MLMFMWPAGPRIHICTCIDTLWNRKKNYMGGCQNYGPILGPRNIRCRIILRTQKGSIILTTTHIARSKPPSTLEMAEVHGLRQWREAEGLVSGVEVCLGL